MKTQTNESVADYIKRGGKVTKLEPSHSEVQVSGDFSNGFLVPRDSKFMGLPDVNSPFLLGDLNYCGGMQ